MSYDGLAGFVAALDGAGELLRVTEAVATQLEAGTLADLAVKRGGPALLFERPSDGELPLLMNAFGSQQRLELALSTPAVEDIAERITRLVRTRPGPSLMANLRLLPELVGTGLDVLPRSKASGPCRQLEVPDLDALPIVQTWPGDAAPFITLGQVITKHAETGERNVGMYRLQKLGPRALACHWQLHKTGTAHFKSWAEAGAERMPVAIALGGDPVYTYAATAPLPPGLDEYMLAGFIRREAVALVPACEGELAVPADADIVIEGWVSPSADRVLEGPFGDHTGYYTLAEPYPKMEVSRITRRSDAIYPATIVGPPPMEDAWLGKATERIFLPLLQLTFPEVVDMNLPVEGAFHNLCILSIRKEYPGHGRKIMHALWGMGQMMFTKVFVVVDEDVDVHDLREVCWRVLANLDAQRDLVHAQGPLDVLDHAPDRQGFGGKLGFDATRKLPEEGYAREWPEVCRHDPDVEERAAARLASWLRDR
jgi:4-hydroxy-3-polyprenylbenzoate decarboxylase